MPHDAEAEALRVESKLPLLPFKCVLSSPPAPAPSLQMGTVLEQKGMCGHSVYTGPPSSQGGSSYPCWTPGLGSPICGWNSSLPRKALCPGNSPFPLSPLPEVTVLDLITSLPFLPASVWIFLTALVVEESFCQSPMCLQ